MRKIYKKCEKKSLLFGIKKIKYYICIINVAGLDALSCI